MLTSYLVLLYPAYLPDTQISYSVGVSIIVLPIAGWLADVYYGCYMFTVYSTSFEFAMLIIYSVLSAIEYSYGEKSTIDYVKDIVVGAGAVGLSGVVANILP